MKKEIDPSNLPEQSSPIEPAEKKGRFQKLGPIVVLLVSFIAGFFYFINLDIVVRYLLANQGIPLDVDKMEITLFGHFEMERFRYSNVQILNGEEIKLEYIKGKVAPFSMLISNNLDVEALVRGVKIPLGSGFISGGSWKIQAVIKNMGKNSQQWSGDFTLSVENAMLKYSVGTSNYVALLKNGRIKGTIKNNMIQLNNSEINADIAKITISGNMSMNTPNNINAQLQVEPLDEFAVKYPNEKRLIDTFLHNEKKITISLNGTLQHLSPQIQNLMPSMPNQSGMQNQPNLPNRPPNFSRPPNG